MRRYPAGIALAALGLAFAALSTGCIPMLAGAAAGSAAGDLAGTQAAAQGYEDDRAAVWLGLTLGNYAVVQEVRAGSPAAKAGILVNDHIAEIETMPVGKKGEAWFHLYMNLHRQDIIVVVLRGKELVRTHVKVPPNPSQKGYQAPGATP